MGSNNIKLIFSSSLFWDAEDIDISKHSDYIISRVLDYGNIEDIRKLLNLYSHEKIAYVTL